MTTLKNLICSLSLFLLCIACNNKTHEKQTTKDSSTGTGHTYAYDADFLAKHSNELVELQNDEGAKVLLSADYQGRVMTSTASGDSGTSYGWINYDLISSGEKRKQFNPVGGENRFWMGPEGGQYSLYFQAGDSFNIAHWQVPAFLDTMAYEISKANQWEADFAKKVSFPNYRGTHFDIQIKRTVTLLDKEAIGEKLKMQIPASIHLVGYETKNSVTNIGGSDWKKENGLPSIWLLGMFAPTPKTVVIIPFHKQKDASSFMTTDYFGKIPVQRLQVKDSVVLFTCDGKYRSKIGLSPVIAKPLAGSFDFRNNVLTLVLTPIDKTGMYVNSKWELQKEPFKGDVINAYNDGPLQDGSQLGPFYEIESSSPAKELKKGETLDYSQVTCHLQGDYNSLREFSKKLLGVDLNQIKNSGFQIPNPK